MPPFLLTLLGARQTWSALGVVLLFGLAGLQTARLSHAKSDLAAARAALTDPTTHRKWQVEAVASVADLAACHAGKARFDAALADQSAAVAKLGEAGAAASAAANQAVLGAQAVSRDAKMRAQALLAAKPVAPGCSGADALILGSLKP